MKIEQGYYRQEIVQDVAKDLLGKVVEAEKAAQAQIGIGCHGTPAGDDFADTLCRNADFLGEAILGDAHGFKKLLQKEFARGDRVEFGHMNALNGSPRSPRPQRPMPTSENTVAIGH